MKKSKKIIFLIALVLISAALFAACSKNEIVDLDYTLNIHETGYEVSGAGNFKTYTGTRIVIPAVYNGLPVTGIKDNAFQGYSNIESVVIPDSVGYIGNHAFNGCKKLRSLIIPDSVATIGHWAFDDCSGLKSIKIGAGVTNIGMFGFARCSSLEKIIVSDGNAVYRSVNNCLLSKNGEFLILGCKTSIIPDSVIRIKLRAFENCTGLTSINIPSSVTAIEAFAFDFCPNLAKIIVSDGNAVYKSVNNCLLSKDGEILFYGCKTSIIPDGVIYIKSLCGSDINSIAIPDSVTYIEGGAFAYCSRITKITIPNSVTFVGYKAFIDCPKLKIYCEAESKPIEWSEDWNFSNCPVEWGYII